MEGTVTRLLGLQRPSHTRRNRPAERVVGEEFGGQQHGTLPALEPRAPVRSEGADRRLQQLLGVGAGRAGRDGDGVQEKVTACQRRLFRRWFGHRRGPGRPQGEREQPAVRRRDRRMVLLDLGPLGQPPQGLRRHRARPFGLPQGEDRDGGLQDARPGGHRPGPVGPLGRHGVGDRRLQRRPGPPLQPRATVSGREHRPSVVARLRPPGQCPESGGRSVGAYGT